LPFDKAQLRFERSYFRAVLEKAGGNKTVAARLAGMDRSNLYDHLNKLKLTEGDETS